MVRSGSTADPLPTIIRLSMIFVAVLLASRAVPYVLDWWMAVRYPFELDYGEGIVWQQADMMLEGRGYGDINSYPFVVFHYPPVYHFTASAISAITGENWLFAGRLVSALSALVAGCLIGRIVAQSSETQDRNLIPAIMAALTFLTLAPVLVWAPLARVDLLAVALNLAGIAFAIASRSRPAMIGLAAVCFVLAVYTKQTSIFASAACFGVLIIAYPKRALIGIGVAVALGLAILIGGGLMTDGRFAEHLFSYNINRFQWDQFARIAVYALAVQMAFYALATLLFGYLFIRIVRKLDWRSISKFSRSIGEDRETYVCTIILAYFVLSCLSLVAAAKSGSHVNYFLEFAAASALIFGAGIRPLALSVEGSGNALFRAIPLLIVGIVGFHALSSPRPIYEAKIENRVPAETQQALVERVEDSERPVLSDDMVLLRLAGQQVPWESAIFAELGSLGRWDENQIVSLIDREAFAFIYTYQSRGTRLFDSRYNPGVADAIDRAYPVKRHIGEFVLHLPDGAADGFNEISDPTIVAAVR